MNENLKNRWAFVTGSARGIGQQIALGLAQCSCNVIIHGRKRLTPKRLIPCSRLII